MNTYDWTMDDAEPLAESAFYLPDAADCLRCGLCLATCPTYQVNPIIEESPRGRVRILDKILNQAQAISADEREHLEHCTQCRACETVCPSRMAYGQLFGEAQARLQSLPMPWLARLGYWLVEHNRLLQPLAAAARFYQTTGLQALARRLGLWRRLKLDQAEALLPAIVDQALASVYPATGSHRGSVGLFIGCLGNFLDRQTQLDAVKVLNRLGYDVLIPNGQRCCGAIHGHQGKTEAVERMMADNRAAFDALALDAVVYTASGCGLMLSEYPTAFRHPLADVNDFVNRHWREHLTLQSLPRTVAVHEPCSQRNSLKNQQAVYDLLAKIPELTVAALPGNNLCCGAGGVNMVAYPDIAQPLRDAKLQGYADSGADCLATSNIGCALHLQAGLTAKAVLHPISLLASQLD